MSIGDSNHSLLGVYGPAANFGTQANFPHFFETFLNLPVTAPDSGIVIYEGVAFNWQRRKFVFCGGQQVLLS